MTEHHDVPAAPTRPGRSRRLGSLSALALVAGLVLTGCGADTSAESPSGRPEATGASDGTSAPASAPEPGAPGGGSESGPTGDNGADPGQESSAPDFPASNTTGLKPLETVTEGDITPKSVVSNGHGLMITNNMMYRHDVTLYDAETREVVNKLSDTVDADEFGVDHLSGRVSGAPVEAVWTQDGQYAYVSQYQITDHGATAEDNCSNGSAITPSLVYRYSVEQEDWDQVIPVGRVPKYVALSPDESTLLVSNWCDKSLSVVDTEAAEEIRQIPLNSMPRGIVVLPDDRTAYVTAMYADEVYRVDLESGDSEVALRTGDRPRHLVLGKDRKHVYLVVTGANQLLKLDAETFEVIDSASTGAEPRTMEISADGTALYVVNYNENTVSKFDAETLEELDRQPTGHLPIGVTHHARGGEVWVANYSGSLSIYDDTDEASTASD